jgi:hypothetical protein
MPTSRADYKTPLILRTIADFKDSKTTTVVELSWCIGYERIAPHEAEFASISAAPLSQAISLSLHHPKRASSSYEYRHDTRLTISSLFSSKEFRR